MKDCTAIRPLLPLLDDEVLEDRERTLVQEHLRQCPACTQAHAKLATMIDAVDDELVPPPPEVWQRVKETVERELQPRPAVSASGRARRPSSGRVPTTSGPPSSGPFSRRAVAAAASGSPLPPGKGSGSDLGKTEMMFGKIALNWRLITRDLLNRALHYQRTLEPQKPLGQILIEKGVLTREQVEEILAYQERIQVIADSRRFPRQAEAASAAATLESAAPLASATGGSARWGNRSDDTVVDEDEQDTVPTAEGPSVDPLVGQIVGGCRVTAVIGRGGMGAIYLARHEALQKEVVVKILPPTSAANERTVQRFFREARAAAMLEHPNVVSVQDVGTTEKGLHYIIMQYVDGPSLEERVKVDGRMTPEAALAIILSVARGLKAAHEAKLVHRDIKADNILITRSGQAKLTDFGLAKDLNSELKLTADGAMIGTPLYMAPEIGRARDIDGRVDIYSLGVTFYYLLTGVQPFSTFSALDILSAKAHDKLESPLAHVPDLPVEFVAVVSGMMVKDRERRYPDMDALLRDLEALDRGLPVKPPPGSAPWGVIATAASAAETVQLPAASETKRSGSGCVVAMLLGLGIAIAAVVILVLMR